MKQSTFKLNEILSGQQSKSEKRVKLARDIRTYNQQAHLARRAVKNRQYQ